MNISKIWFLSGKSLMKNKIISIAKSKKFIYNVQEK